MKPKPESEPVISVVIPAYNEEKFLPVCLKSLKKQDFQRPYEIIIVDNNSQDNTRKTAEKEGARVFFEVKRSVCAARQKGGEEARGEIIVSTDADCIFPQNWLSKIYKVLKNNNGVAAVVGPLDYIASPRWGVWYVKFIFGAVQTIYRFNGRVIYASAANFAFQKKDWLKIGGYNIKLTQGGDEYYLLKRLHKKGKIVYLHDNKVITSGRRLKRGLLYNLFVSLIFYYFFDYIVASRFTGESVTGPFPPVRQEEPVTGTAFLKKVFAEFLFISALIYYCFFSASSQVFGKVIHNGQIEGKVIALTFDDGPNEPYTSEILDILDQYNIKATFFEVGENIERYPDIARRIVREGHIIANHTYSHTFTKALKHPADSEEITKAQEVIYKTTGVKPRFFRPPWFFRDPMMLKTAKKFNLTVVTGTFGSDLEIFQPRYNYERIAEAAIDKARPRTILVFHDGFNNKEANRENTVKAVKLMIPELINKGYHFVTLSELLDLPPYQ